MTGERPTTPDPATVEADIRLVVSGNFHRDALAAEQYDAVVARIRDDPATYAAAFERDYLGGRFDPQLHAKIFAPTLVELVGAAEPEQGRRLGDALLRHYAGALVIYDDADKRALGSALPENRMHLLQRLEDRRTWLRQAMDPEA